MANYRDRGILFKNDHKPAGSNQPDYRGKLDWHGEPIELAGWVREGRSGKFLSLTAKPAGERRSSAREDDGTEETETF